MLTGQQSPEQAAAALETRWNQITDEQGVDVQVEALATYNLAFPTVVDTPGEQLPVTDVSTEGSAFTLEDLLAGLASG